MASKKNPIIARPVDQVADWALYVEAHEHVTKTVLFTAGMLALRSLTKEEREQLYSHANLIHKGMASWNDFEKAADGIRKRNLAGLGELLQAALERLPQESSRGAKVRRAATGQ